MSGDEDSCVARTRQVDLPQGTTREIKKKLRFDHCIHVILLPTLGEYKAAGLHLPLWHSRYEIQCYKDSALEEIQEFMRANKCDNVSQVVNFLYQVDYTNMAVGPCPGRRLSCDTTPGTEASSFRPSQAEVLPSAADSAEQGTAEDATSGPSHTIVARTVPSTALSAEQRCVHVAESDLHLHQGNTREIKKRLSFNPYVGVILIPCIDKYKAAGLHNDLWHSHNELKGYKKSACEEIKEFMRVNNCDKLPQAMKSLYQMDCANMVEGQLQRRRSSSV